MKMAIDIATKGTGKVNPNPLVGAIIVKNGEVIGEGYHEFYGGLHAERNAIKNAISDTVGATMYVTLEPCCHYGKTPPCTDAIIEAGITEVYIGIKDCNPLVAGKGMKILEDAGIKVVCGILRNEILELNKVFLKYITTRTPWITLKTAMTLDGKIAAYTGDSKWITNESSRYSVHKLRSELMAIMVGIGTVEADNPFLNARLEGNDIRQPIRIIVDSNAKIALESNIVKTAKQYRTIVAHTKFASFAKLEKLKDDNVETLECDEKEGLVDLEDLVQKLGSMGIDSILLEGGGTLNFSFLKLGLVDEVYSFIAPKIIGGRNSKTPVEGMGLAKMEEAIQLTDIQIEKFNEDVLIKGKVKHND